MDNLTGNSLRTRQYDTVVFDLDGTLLDTLEDLTDAVNHALRGTGCAERTIAEVRSFVGNGVRRLMELAVSDGVRNPKFEEAFALFNAYYPGHANDKTKPYDGILPLLRKLKAEGYALAIVSNKPDSSVKVLAAQAFEGLFDAAVGERDDCARKPAPDGVYAALAEIGKSARTAVFVGDSDVDVETAKNAGLPLIAVLWGFRDEDCLRERGATRFARTPEEILEHLS